LRWKRKGSRMVLGERRKKEGEKRIRRDII
jgi:hypothetical protein